jgi:DNA-binding NarL/FixJ family response regulator
MGTNKHIKIAIAEDQSIFRNGLMKLLNDSMGFDVVTCVENGKKLVESLEITPVHVALVDFRMPEMNGIEATRLIREKFPNVKVLLLSMYDSTEFVEMAIEKGANGYLSKDDDASEIEKAVLSVYETGYYLNDRTSKMFIAKMMHSGKVQPMFHHEKETFTDAELAILELICQELTTQEIADKLFKSKRTIESARTIMMQKAGARNMVGLVMYAIQNGLVKN